MQTMIAARSPRSDQLVHSATPKADTAPITIMPSTPRLRTPERSTTSSPMAATRSGVATAMLERIRCSMRSAGSQSQPRQTLKRDAVMNQGIAAENVEEEDPLKQLAHLGRHAERGMDGLAADLGHGDDQAGDHGANRIEAAGKGDSDGGEAGGRRDHRLQLLHGGHELADAGEARQAARQQEGEPHNAAAGESGKARRLGREARDLDLVALHAVGEE